MQSPQHGGHRAFGVRSAPAPDFAVAQFSAEWGDGHATNADGVGVGGEEDAWFGGAVCAWMRWEATYYIGARRFDFFERDLGTGSP